MQSRVEKRAINRFLKNNGLPNLDASSGLMEALAKKVIDHDHLQSLLCRCDPKERVNMYDSLKPHLKFTPHALDVYIAEAAMKAEAKQMPTWDGKRFHEYNPFSVRTMWRTFVKADNLNADRLLQAMRYLQRDIPDHLQQSVIYKVHLMERNGEQWLELSAGVFINGQPQRIQ